jgi:alanine racemase
MDEAVELRNEGVKTPILILGYTDVEDFERAITNDITLAVYDVEEMKVLSEKAVSLGKKAKVHIKVDSGMSRIGFQCDEEGVKDAFEIYNMEGLDVEGIFTHYAKADYMDKGDAEKQYKNFTWFVTEMEKRGAEFKIKHIDNSAGAMEIHSEGYDMVRLGIVIYGLYPSEEIDKRVVLKPAMTLKAKVIHIKTLPAGRGIGYGWTYVTEKDTRVATVSVGYADGYPRALSNKGRVLINGEYAPILGRVCMDQIMVDVTEIEKSGKTVKVDDEVVLFGTQGDKTISVEEVAEPANSFNYEEVCNISRRVPRVYIKNQKEESVLNYLV